MRRDLCERGSNPRLQFVLRNATDGLSGKPGERHHRLLLFGRGHHRRPISMFKVNAGNVHGGKGLRSLSSGRNEHRRRVGLILIGTGKREGHRVEVRNVPLEERANQARAPVLLVFKDRFQPGPDNAHAVDPIRCPRVSMAQMTHLVGQD